MGRKPPYPPEVRGRAVWMVLDQSTNRNCSGRRSVDGDSERERRAEDKRITDLERENRELRRANEIRKVASVFCARELDPQAPKEMTAFIDEDRARFGVKPICRVLQVAPSTHYAVKPAGAVCARTARRRAAD